MELPRRSQKLRAVGLALSASSLAISLTACGTQGDGNGASGSSCSGSAPGITNNEIKLGLLWGDSGQAAASLPNFRAGVETRIDLANDTGGVNGRKITYVWRDDQSDPALNLRAAQILVNEQNVFGLVEGPGASAGSLDWLNQQNVPVTGLGTDPGWVGRSNMFSFLYLGDGSSTVWGDVIRSQGGTRVALFATGAKSNTDFTRQYMASLAAAKVPVISQFPISQATATQTIAQQLKLNNIDALGGVLLPDTAISLLPAARALGVQLKVVVMPIGYDQSILQKAGGQLAGVIISSATRPWQLNTPQQQAFLTAMEKYAPQVRPATQDSAADGYASTDLFVRGLQAAGKCPTRQSFISGLRAVTNYDGAGLVQGNINLSTNYKQPQSCQYFVQVSPDGQRFLPMFNGQAQCGTPISAAQMDQLLS